MLGAKGVLAAGVDGDSRCQESGVGQAPCAIERARAGCGRWFYPLALGTGKRLFPEGKRVNFKLVESVALPTGVIYQRYQPAE